MRLVLLSDTHTRNNFEVPDGDILIHAGDATFQGNYAEVFDFARWYSKFPHEYKLFVAGNHDWGFQRQPEIFRGMIQDVGIIYLEDSRIEIEKIKIYGSPYSPEFCNWAFGYSRYDGESIRKWAMIPDDTQILITHGPPKGIGDRTLPYECVTPYGIEYEPPRHVGCHDLLNRINELKDLRLHVCGHIHAAYGVTKIGNVTYANASICRENYRPDNAPIVIDWPISPEKTTGTL